MAKKATIKTNETNNNKKTLFKGNSETVKYKSAMLKAMEVSLCIVSSAAKKANISRITHYQWIKEDNAYKSAVEELDNIALDFTESMMFKRIKEGSDVLIKYVMSTKGAKRGYTEKLGIELSGKNGGAIETKTSVTINVKRNRDSE